MDLSNENDNNDQNDQALGVGDTNIDTKSQANDEKHGTLKLPSGTTQSSIERVWQWNNQADVEIPTTGLSRSGPPSPASYSVNRRRTESVPDTAALAQNGMKLLADDMGLSHPVTSHDSAPFDLINYSHSPTKWSGNHNAVDQMQQLKANYLDELSFHNDIIFLDEPMSDDTEGGVFANYLKCHSCYEIVPKSAKIVIFDTRLLVKKAFYALVANGVRSAPLWDNGRQEYVGMLTISDFINILVSYYKSPMVQMEEVEEHRIETWRELSKHKLPSSLIHIAPFQSLYEACEILIKHKIHRLPVIDPSSANFLFVISHKRILHYLHEHFSEMVMPDFMYKTLGELGIGTLCKIATISPDTPLIVALNMFAEHKVSALPIVDENGVVVDIYARFDVINLAAEKSYNNLDVPVIEALKHRAEGFEGVHRCRLNEPLHAIVERIVRAGVHRLVVVDKDDHIAGVLSLSDLLQVLVLHPPGVISAVSDVFSEK